MTMDSLRKEWRCVWEHVVTFLPDAGVLSRLRDRYYIRRLRRVGARFSIASGGRIFSPGQVSVGDDVSIGRGTFVDASDGGVIELGNGIGIGPYCVLRAADHRFDDPNVPFRQQAHASGKIVLEDDVWLGAHVVVTRNVRIGRGAVIGAHSVVTHDVPPLAIAAGVPARVIGRRGETKQAGFSEV